MTDRCPSCASEWTKTLLRWESVPTNSAIFPATAAEAHRIPRAAFRLDACTTCGLLYNAEFDPDVVQYGSDYIETQAHSATHRAFLDELATTWTTRHHLGQATVLEVGCGRNAEFLELLSSSFGCTTIGLDPACDLSRATARMTLRTDLFDGSQQIAADALVCRHTLEHIGDIAAFLGTVRAWAGRYPSAVHLFEVPDTTRILAETAFWDMYYEHAAYFTLGSLRRAFSRAGFRVLSVERACEDQYLLLEAVPTEDPGPDPGTSDVTDIVAQATAYAGRVEDAVRAGRERLTALAADGPVVLWQAGSKAVSYLTLLGHDVGVEAVVDINPAKAGRFLVTGHPIVRPEDLARIRPRHVVAMNGVYLDEIRASLAAAGIDATLLTAEYVLRGNDEPETVRGASA